MVGYAYKLPPDEIEAYNTYRAARLTFTQPWTLCGEPPSQWWMNRVLIYSKAEADAEVHMFNRSKKG